MAVAPTPEPVDDKAAAIARDVAATPPQKQVPQQDASRLRTSRLTLGGLLDRPVHGAENSEVGRVIDVMVGEDGQPAALELDVGGFMGVGNRRIAVAWALFDLSRLNGSEPLRVALTEAQVKSAPAAEGSAEVAVVTGAELPPTPKPLVPVVAVPARPAAPPIGPSRPGSPAAAVTPSGIAPAPTPAPTAAPASAPVTAGSKPPPDATSKRSDLP